MFMQASTDSQNQVYSTLMAGSDRIPQHDWAANPLLSTTRSSKIEDQSQSQSYPTKQGLNSTLSGAADQAVRDDQLPTSSQDIISKHIVMPQSRFVNQQVTPVVTPGIGGANSVMTDFFDFNSFGEDDEDLFA